MSLAIVYSRASAGIAAPLVTVEVHLSNGMAGLNIVGLPETAVRESKDRVRSALMHTHFEFPIRRITINLAPADLPKEGARFDLPIALGILAASGQLPRNVLAQYEFAGELALSGELRPIHGVLPLVLGIKQTDRQLIIPEQNAQEAALVNSAQVLAAKHLLEVCAHLQGQTHLQKCTLSNTPLCVANEPDLSDVKGQPHAKRALEIAAAGRHSLLYIGPPGTGKTMLASRLPSILPALNEDEALELAAVLSVSHQGFDPQQWKKLPFRAPHHSSSSVALVGGGRPPRPGEISLAHHGVLFLDELPEFNRHVLECLREPLESGHITISRAAFQTLFPAHFQFLAAMNPCPCGFAGSNVELCQCSPEQIKRYVSKISGPLLSRIDMQVHVINLTADVLANLPIRQEEKSEYVKMRVSKAREVQYQRQKKYNSALLTAELEDHIHLNAPAQKLLAQMMTRFNLSARAYHRVMKLARTIADLEGVDHVDESHIGEAFQYRCLDRSKNRN